MAVMNENNGLKYNKKIAEYLEKELAEEESDKKKKKKKGDVTAELLDGVITMLNALRKGM